MLKHIIFLCTLIIISLFTGCSATKETYSEGKASLNRVSTEKSMNSPQPSQPSKLSQPSQASEGDVSMDSEVQILSDPSDRVTVPMTVLDIPPSSDASTDYLLSIYIYGIAPIVQSILAVRLNKPYEQYTEADIDLSLRQVTHDIAEIQSYGQGFTQDPLITGIHPYLESAALELQKSLTMFKKLLPSIVANIVDQSTAEQSTSDLQDTAYMDQHLENFTMYLANYNKKLAEAQAMN